MSQKSRISPLKKNLTTAETSEKYIRAYLGNDLDTVISMLDEYAEYDMPNMKEFYCRPELAFPALGRLEIIKKMKEIWSDVIPCSYDEISVFYSGNTAYYYLIFHFRKKGEFLAGWDEENKETEFYFSLPCNIILNIENQRVIHHVDYADWSVIYSQIREQVIVKARKSA